MPTPFENRVKRFVLGVLNQQVPQRAAVMNYASQMSQSGAGIVESVDTTRRTVMVSGVGGGSSEFCLQNRWVSKNEVVGAIGGRAL